MSLASGISDLASRIATEFVTVRAEADAALAAKVAKAGDVMTGALTLPRLEFTPQAGTAKARFGGLTGVEGWTALFLNCQYVMGSGWLLDDPTKIGWYISLDSRAASPEFRVCRIPAGAGYHTDETTLIHAANDGTVTFTNRVTGVANATGATDALPKGQADTLYSASGHSHSGVYEPLITAGTTAQFWRGDKTWQSLFDATLPAALGVAAAGSAVVAARRDHVHAIPTAAQVGAEPAITAGTTSQYRRGDKTWQTLDKAAVGLGSVDNTSDASKPVSTATQTALNAKAPLVSPAFTTSATLDGQALVKTNDTRITADQAAGTASIRALGTGATQAAAGNHSHAAIAAWPVGSIFMAVVPTNPATLLGGGTWVAWGTGRMPVAIDPAQTEFDTVEETGGAKTHTLTEANLPPHAHSIFVEYAVTTPTTGAAYRVVDVANATGGTGTNATGNTGNGAGTSTPVTHLPPYITCYMWKRTA